jgi:glycerophosphoryl diester phosphodiesterase
VCAQNCPSALFNLDMTADEQLVVLDKQTLEQAKIHKTINKITFDDLKDFNIAEIHPLGKGIQKILTLDALIKLLEASNVNVIFLSKRTDLAFVEKLRQAISTHEALFSKRIVFCSQSPITIFKVSSG